MMAEGFHVKGFRVEKPEEIKPALEGYLSVMFDANPASIGGAMPKEDFYWSGK